jgi:rRNA maturation RNase YbeY
MISYACMGKPPNAFPDRLLPRIARECSRMCGKRARRNAVIGLRFVSEAKIAELNRAYRGRDCPTDVLSFSATEKGSAAFPEPALKDPATDITVCAAVAVREARRRAVEPAEELVRLVVHGTLHLLGYDHADARTGERMLERQERIVERAYGEVGGRDAVIRRQRSDA